MSATIDLSGIELIDWSKLAGAYGASVGSHDVAAALRTIATDLDEDSDDRMDALDVVLFSHGWHQGTIYPVTAAIVPFLVALIEGGRDTDGTLAAGLEHYASATAAPDNADDAAAVVSTLEAAATTFIGWREERARTVAIVATFVPALRARWLEVLVGGAISTIEFFALAALNPPPAWSLDRARGRVDDVGAAVLLALHGTPDPVLARAIEATLEPQTAALFQEVLGLLGIRIPTVRAPFAGELLEARVAFVGPKLVLVRAGEQNVTLKISNTGLTRGDRVRVGLSAHGEPRIVELPQPDGRVLALTLD